MAKSRAQKAESLEQLTQAFKQGKSVMFADYQGMNVAKVATLRKQLRTAGVEYIVSKKTLLKIAAKEAGYELNISNLPGMLGAAFAREDEMVAAKIIGDAGRTGMIKLVSGIFDGKIVDKNFVVTLSQLPSKDQLLGQLLSVINGPASAFVRVLNANREKLEAASPVAEAAPAPAAPAAEPAPEAAPAEVAPEAPAAPAAEAPAADASAA